MSEPIRVGVLGARGRMGQQVCRAVDAAPDLDLVAMVDAGDWLFSVADAGAQVLVDFTHPDVVMDNVRFAVDQGIHAVVGTTGFTAERLDTVRELAGRRAARSACWSRRTSASARCCRCGSPQLAARFYESAEVIELHHPGKADAPSGTAIRTAELIAAGARPSAGSAPAPDATTQALDGARGADVDGVRVHALRIAGLVAHRRSCFGTEGETLTIRHDSLRPRRRSCRACCWRSARSLSPSGAHRRARAAARPVSPRRGARPQRRRAAGRRAGGLLRPHRLPRHATCSVSDRSELKVLGVAVLVLPLVGIWVVVAEMRFGLATQRLAGSLDAEGAPPEPELPRTPSGRVDRAAADGLFDAAPGRGRGRSRGLARAGTELAAAYDLAGDRRRARAAMREPRSAKASPDQRSSQTGSTPRRSGGRSGAPDTPTGSRGRRTARR